MSEKILSLNLSFDQPVSPSSEASQRVLEISIRAAQAAGAAPRPNLNLALVLDRSGSMAGEKLDFVKQAARHVVALLDEHDRLALVDYDDEVRVLAASAPMTSGQRALVQRLISGIDAGATTNLSGGWASGCQQVASGMQQGGQPGVNRTLLLTDGLANVGMTHPDELAYHAGEMAVRGVFTSTFGVGTGFNHELLEMMATQGEGTFYFIECPEDIPNIFKREFAELSEVAASNVELTLHYPTDWETYIPGSWRELASEPGKLRLRAGSVGAGRSADIYVRFTIPAAKDGDDTQLRAAQLRAAQLRAVVRATAPDGQLLEDESALELRLGSQAEVEAAPVNNELLERFARVDMAHTTAESLKLEQRGERERASRQMQEKLREHRQRLNQDTQQEAMQASQRMLQGMEEIERKRMHSSAYSMKRRRDVFETFSLVPHTGGHLVIDYYGTNILLDTGSPVTIGDRPMFELMGRHNKVQREYMGVTLDYLTKVIGTRIDYLLGIDVLHWMFLEIDTTENRVLISYEANNIWRNTPKTLNYVQYVPYATFDMAGEDRPLYIDTSAKLSYLSRKAVQGLESIDTERDFYPGLGEFDTEVFLAPLRIDGDTVMLRCGVLPELLEKALLLSGVQGILGTELYQYYWAHLAFPQQKLDLQRHPDFLRRS